MSISASLANALTGLTASSRAAELVSSNVANAMNENYARREIVLTAKFTGGLGAGVRVDGVNRVVDEITLRERRLAEANVANAKTGVDFFQDLMALIGEPGNPGSLSGLGAEFESAILEATSRPDSEARLATLLTGAQSYSTKLNTIADGIQGMREDADAAIEREVDRLNQSLEQVAELNTQILRLNSVGKSYPDLLDQRQSLLDDISELVPIRVLRRENDTVALYSMGGAKLLDATKADFGFEAKAPITADMSVQSGALSQLTIDGRTIDASTPNSQIAGGRLAGLFYVRDVLAPTSQGNLDELARDLISRFESPGPDPTLAPGNPGLFTDAGRVLDPSDIVGLSSRVVINSLVDPNAGGDLWRLRDGLGAAAEGPTGNRAILSQFQVAVERSQLPVGGGLGTASKTLADFSAAFLSSVGQSLSSSARQMTFDSSRLEILKSEELSLGVDTDQEMQKLLLIEKSYAANAKVIQTIDELIQTLIGL